MRSAALLASLVAALSPVSGCGGGSAPAPALAPVPASANVAKPGGQGAKAAPAALQSYDARTFFETVSAFAVGFSADEQRLLLGSDQSGIFNAYAQPAAGGKPQPLTASRGDGIFPVAFFPRDDRFLYTSNQGGNELDHLFVAGGSEGDKPRDLTPGDKLKAIFLGFSDDDRSFFALTNERDPRAFDLYRYEVDGYKRQLVFENRGGFMPGPVSPSGRWLALLRENDNTDSDIFLVDLQARRRAGKPRYVTPHKGKAEHAPLAFTHDSSQLIYGSNEQGEFDEAWSYAVEGGERKPYVRAQWDVTSVVFSRHGKYSAVTTNQDARTVLDVTELASGKRIELPAVPAGDITRVVFSPSESRMALHVNGDRAPTNVYLYEFGGGELKQLTDTLNPAVAPEQLVDGKVVRYTSFDGLEIPAILYQPHRASAQSKVPALLWVHGGPGGQSRLGYQPLIQHLVNHGYAVLSVNNRGSNGYGKTFFHADDRKHGEADLDDCVWARKYLAGIEWIDGERIGIMGGSYGGYMVLAALAFRPREFALGIDIFGVANWVRTLESIPAWWASQRIALYAELGDPAKDRERLTKISPLFHAEKIERPLLVIQGANDPRVLKVESDEMVAAVRARNVPVEYVQFDDEGHGFIKRENRITAQERYLRFLEMHLGGKASRR